MLLYVAAFILVIPSLTLSVECLLALLPLTKRRITCSTPRPTLVVLVPAHNEERGICETIVSIQPQLTDADRLVVIADNCTDSTAQVARNAGAIVWERNDNSHRGKGFALRFAFDRLALEPPEAVICIDADCVLDDGCLNLLGRAAVAWDRPVQGAYLMHPPVGAGPSIAVSSFAVLVKNYVRLRGLQRLRLPCLITGSGVAYPWHVLQKVPHPEGHIVEDMRFSTDLAMAGYAPWPLMQAVVHAQLPTGKEAVKTQRTRWEHGHLSVLFSEAPRLLKRFFHSGSPALIALMLELIVPPLSLLVPINVGGGAGLVATAAFSGKWGPTVLWASVSAFSVASVGLAWHRFGRSLLRPRHLLAIPRYAVAKLPMYRQFVYHRESQWVRTDRAIDMPSRQSADKPIHNCLPVRHVSDL